MQSDHANFKLRDSTTAGTGGSRLYLVITEGDSLLDRTVMLSDGVSILLGRASHCEISVPGDQSISREHADLVCEGEKLTVTCRTKARNPLICHNESARELTLFPDESFRIGSTTFRVHRHDRKEDATVAADVTVSHPNTMSATKVFHYTADELQSVAFHDTEHQMGLLARLPQIISDVRSDAELGQALCGLLLEAIPAAEAVAVAHYDLSQIPDDLSSMAEFPSPLTLRMQTREDLGSAFRPSRQIIVKTLREQESVLHIWSQKSPTGTFTVSAGLQWALCAPIRGESSLGWCMYVSGTGVSGGGPYVSKAALAADVRFTELVAQFIGSVRQVQALQEEKSKLNLFFSPKIIDSLARTSDQDVLSPAERNITVLFCDVRGFSRRAERLQNNLMELLRSVNAALGVMVDGILERDGSIADFQGDAAMGFWGWPVAVEYGPIPACRAAIAIFKGFRDTFHHREDLLQGFSVGIGIAHGRAVAGQIGTVRQAKIGVFGPVVNQCARLESMTKQFGVSICIDGSTAEFVDRYLSPEEARLRRLARVQPLGMTTHIDVYHLLPGEHEFPDVSRQMIEDHQAALTAVDSGHWDEAIELLEQIPDDDGPKQFLLRQLSAHGNTPPPDWNGVFRLATK